MKQLYSTIMDKRSVLQFLEADFALFDKEFMEFSKTGKNYVEETKSYINTLISQIDPGSDSLLTKTPKVPKKRATRIKTIPENDETENDSTLSNTSHRSSRLDSLVSKTSDIRPSRSKRGASTKASEIIKKQQSITLNTKMRRPSDEDGNATYLTNKTVRESRSKRPKEGYSSLEDEDIRPSKVSKIEKQKSQSENKTNDVTRDIINDWTESPEENKTINSTKHTRASVKRKFEEDNEEENLTLKSEESLKQNTSLNDEPVAKKAHYSKSSLPKNEKNSKFMISLDRISEKSSSTQSRESNKRTTRSSASIINAQSSKPSKTNNIINETVDMSNADETVASMYEDAISKAVPVMNSTMNPNSTVTFEKMMNVTVLIEPLSSKKIFDETVTIKKNSFKEPLSYNSTVKEIPEKNNDVPLTTRSSSKNERITNSKLQADMKIDKLNDLITDDESSPERKEYKVKKEKLISNQPKRVTRSNASVISDDELRTPVGKVPLKDFKGTASKSVFKQTALFSPYAKDSVKKRVQAFEQVVSPMKNENDTAGRITRTKTRALAAASFVEAPAPTISQKLARKSLAKAKKISLAKHAKENEDTKENDTTYVKSTKTSSLERSAQKPQPKTTPLGKNRMLQLPSSVSKIQYGTPSNTQSLNSYSKPLTSSRGNIVTHVDSFIQPMKSASKVIDKVAEEKRRRAHDEDARRKREELLKAQAEERRRKREEKELKNKLAREAKEKLEYEKRLKAEREREEKARLAQQMQEKQREEIERKRIAQIQKALEKEERRKQEELLRMQRLQEQEDQERQLAEQKRREQEMEKRKQIAEMKLKNQMDKALMQAKAKALAQKQVPTSYKIDSDPDEDDSDDESRPKHQIPPWATKQARQAHLAMQQHIPMKSVLRFFDARKCTPDLRDLFQGIDPKKLKRSSSAIWKTPPRYSMMNCSLMKD